MEKKSKAYQNLKARFDQQYIRNGGSPIHNPVFDDKELLDAQQLKHLVRYTVIQLLSRGLCLDEFISVAKDPLTWYPHEVFDDPTDTGDATINPTYN